VEKHLGLEAATFRLWWRSRTDDEDGAFRPVPSDAESIWEKTDNFVPAIPTAFEQEPELTIFVEECDSEQALQKEDFGRILIFLKLYDPVTQEVTDVGKMYPHCYTDAESVTLWDLTCRNLVLNTAKIQDCSQIYMIRRRTDCVEKLTFYDEQDGVPCEREVAGENGDICVVELCSSPGETGIVNFDDYFDTLRNTRDILLKSRIETCDYPTEFLLSLTLSTDCASLREQVRRHLLQHGRPDSPSERLVVDSVELYQCYWSSVSGLSPRPAEFPVDPQFDGTLDDLLKSGSKEEPRLYFSACTRLEAVDGDDEDETGAEEEDPVQPPERKRARIMSED